jgi:hypothetical protein
MPNYDLSLGDDFSGDDAGDDMGDDMGDDSAGWDDANMVVSGRRRRRGGGGGSGRRSQPSGQTQVLPFPRTVMTTLLQSTIQQFPQRPFQTRRLVIGSSIGVFFSIEELKIGQDSMFVQAGSVDFEIFNQTGNGVALLGFIARPGVTITLTITNRDTQTRTFSAGIIGTALVA